MPRAHLGLLLVIDSLNLNSRIIERRRWGLTGEVENSQNPLTLQKIPECRFTTSNFRSSITQKDKTYLGSMNMLCDPAWLAKQWKLTRVIKAAKAWLPTNNIAMISGHTRKLRSVKKQKYSLDTLNKQWNFGSITALRCPATTESTQNYGKVMLLHWVGLLQILPTPTIERAWKNSKRALSHISQPRFRLSYKKLIDDPFSQKLCGISNVQGPHSVSYWQV